MIRVIFDDLGHIIKTQVFVDNADNSIGNLYYKDIEDRTDNKIETNFRVTNGELLYNLIEVEKTDKEKIEELETQLLQSEGVI